MPIRTILCPTAYGPLAEPALRHAAFLAERHDAALHVLHVLEDGNPSARALEMARDHLSSFLQSFEIEAVEAVLASQDVAPAIADYADRHAVDLVVMGTHGRSGVRRLLLGSVAEALFRIAPCPLVALRERGTAFPRGPLDGVLVPLDLSEHSRRVLPLAKEFAAAYGATLHVLHVVADLNVPFYGAVESPLAEAFPEIRVRARSEMERALAAAPGPDVPTEVHFAHGDATDTIVEWAEAHGVDLIALTRTGWRGVTGLLVGSVANGIVRGAPCPILVVPVLEDEERDLA
ncbi:MAG: universal stress protein [Rhodothermales bacterium]|nr:universal stress protein [Rhodothermales bacterium]